MKIEPCFPLECCDKCKSARPYTSQQMFYAEDEVVEQVIVVGCEHEQECRTIFNFLKEQVDK